MIAELDHPDIEGTSPASPFAFLANDNGETERAANLRAYYVALASYTANANAGAREVLSVAVGRAEVPVAQVEADARAMRALRDLAESAGRVPGLLSARRNAALAYRTYVAETTRLLTIAEARYDLGIDRCPPGDMFQRVRSDAINAIERERRPEYDRLKAELAAAEKAFNVADMDARFLPQFRAAHPQLDEVLS
jgi:hypothetical protein